MHGVYWFIHNEDLTVAMHGFRSSTNVSSQINSQREEAAGTVPLYPIPPPHTPPPQLPVADMPVLFPCSSNIHSADVAPLPSVVRPVLADCSVLSSLSSTSGSLKCPPHPLFSSPPWREESLQPPCCCCRCFF